MFKIMGAGIMKTKDDKVKVVQSIDGELLNIELSEDLLKRNEELAQENRKILEEKNILAIDILGAIGSGKTSLIENILIRLKKKRAGVIAGDLTTTIDAERIKSKGAQTVQANTGKECHLDASLIRKALSKLNLDTIDLLFIENVGNLICPREFNLGAHKRVVVISVTEGPYTIIKHPYIFQGVDAVVINKVDLADAMDINLRGLEADALRVNSHIKIIETNCRTGQGVKKVMDALDI